MTRRREIERRARKRRGSRVVRGVRASRTRAFDEPIFEDEEREVPLGGDDKPPSGQ
jgi:hypothetical protein